MKTSVRILLLYLLFISTGNAQWATYNLPHNGVAYCMDFYNLNNGVSCGHTLLPFYEKPYYTTNSGSSWIQALCPSTIRAISNVKFINATTLYAAGAENLLIFNNAEKIYGDYKYLPNFVKSSMMRLGRTGNPAEYKGAFISSTNAGVSWQKVSQFDTLTGYLMDLHFFNANTGFVIADSGNYGNDRILKTTNGGINWQIIRIEPLLNLQKLLFVNINTGFTSGFKNYDTLITGVLFRTTNSGANWVKTNFGTGDGYKDISFSNSTTGFAICQGNYAFKIYKTTNTGITWDSISYFQNVLSECIKTVPGTGTIYVVGTVDSSFYFKTFTAKSTNYGISWAVKYFYWNEEIFNGCLVDQNNWFMCGGNYDVPAVILKSTNGGAIFINKISSGVPEKYSLYQNYPNPFNPTTNIKFDILKAGNVILKIFDITGKEVAEPVNEKLSEGTYNVVFDASKLSSGLYCYRITSGDFTGVKKMILVK